MKLVAFFLVLAGIIQPLAFSLPTSLKPSAHQRDSYNWQARHEAVKKRNAEIKPAYVMIGDSITHHWGGLPIDGFGILGKDSWDQVFSDFPVTNMGFGFDYVDNAYYRAENGELDGFSPRVIILLLGTNNLGHRKDSAADCAANMKAFLDLLLKKCPRSKILLLGVLPRMEPELVDVIRQTNVLYKKLAAQDSRRRIIFVDAGKSLLEKDSPHPQKKYMADAVHLNAEGYRVLGGELETALGKIDPKYLAGKKAGK